MAEDYVPSTDAVREGYSWSGHDSYVESNREVRGQEFDAWLEEQIRVARQMEKHNADLAIVFWEQSRDGWKQRALEAENRVGGALGVLNNSPYKYASLTNAIQTIRAVQDAITAPLEDFDAPSSFKIKTRNGREFDFGRPQTIREKLLMEEIRRLSPPVIERPDFVMDPDDPDYQGDKDA